MIRVHHAFKNSKWGQKAKVSRILNQMATILTYIMQQQEVASEKCRLHKEVKTKPFDNVVSIVIYFMYLLDGSGGSLAYIIEIWGSC